MKNIGMTWLLWVGAVCFAAGAAACASAPPESFYKLSSGVREAVTPPRTFTRTVVVMRAGLPESVDRPQLVTVVDVNRVAILEQQRWAEPLRVGIPRVVAESLTRLLGSWRVSSREDVIQNPDCRVNLDVRRFDANVGAGAGAGAAVNVETVWTVACEGRERRMGQSIAHEVISGMPFEAIVAAHGRALDSVSRDIAQALLEPRDPGGPSE